MNRKLFAFLALATIFFSCSNDDNAAEATIVGSWNAVEYNLETSVDLNNDGTESNDIMKELDCFAFMVTFGETGTFSSTVTSLTTTDNGDGTTSVDCDGGNVSNTGTYTLVGNTLTITIDGDPVVSTANLSKNSLTVTGEDETLGDYTVVLERK